MKKFISIILAVVMSLTMLTTVFAENGYGLYGLQYGNEGWAYYIDDEVYTSYTGVTSNDYGYWYVENGYLNFNYTGTFTRYGSTYYIQNGWAIDGLSCFDGTWKYYSNGHFYDWWTGLACNEYGWWYVNDGCVDFTYTGRAYNEYGKWWVVNGAVDFNHVWIEHSGFQCINGVWGYYSLLDQDIDTSYTGIVSNEYGKWYVENGYLNWKYTGTYTTKYGLTYKVVNGYATLK